MSGHLAPTGARRCADSRPLENEVGGRDAWHPAGALHLPAVGTLACPVGAPAAHSWPQAAGAALAAGTALEGWQSGECLESCDTQVTGMGRKKHALLLWGMHHEPARDSLP